MITLTRFENETRREEVSEPTLKYLRNRRHVPCTGVRTVGAMGGCSPSSYGNNVIFRAKRS